MDGLWHTLCQSLNVLYNDVNMWNMWTIKMCIYFAASVFLSLCEVQQLNVFIYFTEAVIWPLLYPFNQYKNAYYTGSGIIIFPKHTCPHIVCAPFVFYLSSRILDSPGKLRNDISFVPEIRHLNTSGTQHQIKKISASRQKTIF